MIKCVLFSEISNNVKKILFCFLVHYREKRHWSTQQFIKITSNNMFKYVCSLYNNIFKLMLLMIIVNYIRICRIPPFFVRHMDHGHIIKSKGISFEKNSNEFFLFNTMRLLSPRLERVDNVSLPCIPFVNTGYN